ncbi:MAG: 16S rRNA (guanine1207-N2)-methyltransferase [Myxococcota bacterium]
MGRTRDVAAGQVLADAILADDPPGSALVIGESTGAVAAVLANLGAEVHSWNRFAHAGQAATAWAPDAKVELAVVRLPKARRALEMVLHIAAARLVPGGRLLLAGGNDEGAKSAGGTLSRVYGTVVKAGARKHCRVWRGSDPIDAPRGDRSQWAERVEAGGMSWLSWPGLFAHGRLDGGTALLLRAIPRLEPGARVLDFGCGAGVIGLSVANRQPAVAYEGVDVDALAIAAAADNVPGGRFTLSDGLPPHTGDGYDLIVSNPPLHTGVSRDARPLGDLLIGAPKRLAPKGVLLLVTQKGVALSKPLEAGFQRVDLAAERGGFRVWRAQAPR